MVVLSHNLFKAKILTWEVWGGRGSKTCRVIYPQQLPTYCLKWLFAQIFFVCGLSTLEFTILHSLKWYALRILIHFQLIQATLRKLKPQWFDNSRTLSINVEWQKVQVCVLLSINFCVRSHLEETNTGKKAVFLVMQHVFTEPLIFGNSGFDLLKLWHTHGIFCRHLWSQRNMLQFE